MNLFDLFEVAVAQVIVAILAPVVKALQSTKEENITESFIPLNELNLKANVLFRSTLLNLTDCLNRVVNHIISH